jgi:hypothetical protein
VPSAEQPSAVALTLSGLVVAAALAGCATTQQEAARIQLNDARIRASQVPTTVGHPSGAVAVGPVQLIATRGRRTFVVVVRNLRSTPISDNPISVGVIGPGGQRSLNSAAGLSYFATHLPSVSGHGELRWVVRTAARIGTRPRLFAIVGRAPRGFGQPPSVLPSITVALVRRGAGRGDGGREITVLVRNGSSIPQYQLPVYALERRGGRYVDAGSATLGTLGSGASRTIRIELSGQPAGGRLELEAPPTIDR